MAQGRKTGGRVKGSLNRRTIEVQARLEELGCDPISGMAMIAMDVSNPPELRGRLFAELAQYVAPKRRAIDLGQNEGHQVHIHMGIRKRPDSDGVLVSQSAASLLAKVDRRGRRNSIGLTEIRSPCELESELTV
jgi:hypothetical protein